jgi:hypothetical protein
MKLLHLYTKNTGGLITPNKEHAKPDIEKATLFINGQEHAIEKIKLDFRPPQHMRVEQVEGFENIQPNTNAITIHFEVSYVNNLDYSRIFCISARIDNRDSFSYNGNRLELPIINDRTGYFEQLEFPINNKFIIELTDYGIKRLSKFIDKYYG